MKKEVRRILLLCTIVTVGLILVFLDVTFIQLLVIVLAVGIILPFLLGMVTVAEVRDSFGTFKEQKLKKISLLRKLDEIKLFEKKGAARVDVPQPTRPVKTDMVPQQPKKPGVPEGGKKFPFSTQITSVIDSFKSLGSVIREKTRRERKVTDINTMLDSAVSEKVTKAPPAAGSGSSVTSHLPAPGGAGSAPADETDPFLSLSNDEFDAGLLDGLDDTDMPGTSPDAAATPAGSPDTGLPEPELSMPSMDFDSAAGDILKENAAEGGLDDLGGLEPGGDTDLGDLDNLSLDDVDLDAELEDGESGEGGSASPAAAETPSPAEPAPAAAAAPGEPAGAVKTTWIPSDAPKGAEQEDLIGTQSDMAAFASGSGGSDEDLLSSIASDVKRTTKEKDISLLRELKDFKAPADQIESELSDMYKQLSNFPKKKELQDPSTNQIK